MRLADISKKVRGEAQTPFVVASLDPQGSINWYSSVGAEACFAEMS